VTARGWLRFAGVLVLTSVVQGAVLNGVVVGGAHPDAFLLVAVVAGLTAGAQQGAVLGFVTGLVADLFLPTPYGFSAFCFVLVAFAVGLAAGAQAGRSPYGFRIVTAVVGSIGGTLLFAALETLLGQPHPGFRDIVVVCAVVAAGNAVLAIPATALVFRAVTAGGGSQRDLAGAGGSATVR